MYLFENVLSVALNSCLIQVRSGSHLVLWNSGQLREAFEFFHRPTPGSRLTVKDKIKTGFLMSVLSYSSYRRYSIETAYRTREALVSVSNGPLTLMR